MTLIDRPSTARTDALWAVALTLAGLVQVVLFPIAPRGLGELYVVGSTLPLAWRRTRPLEAALVSAAFWLVPLDGYPLLGFVAVVLQFFSVGAFGAPRRAVVATTVVASVLSAVGTLLGPELPVAAIGAVIVVVAPVLAGRVVRHQRLQNEELARLTEELRRQRARAEEAAVGAERARIAQELHDVVGHEVTLIAIQAEAAGAALRLAPDRAAEPIETIRSTAHRVLTEMRGVVDVLAPVGADDDLAHDLGSLVTRSRVAGLEVSLTETGSRPPEQSPESLAVYRIVRECLTNAARHAPGQPVSVEVSWGPERVAVAVTNPYGGQTSGQPGRGLTGVRHRAELLGGRFAVDTGDQRFTVRVTLPLGEREPR